MAAASAESVDVDAFEEGPGAQGCGSGEVGGGELVACELVVGLVGEAVLRDGGDGLAGDEEGDGEVAERRQVEAMGSLTTRAPGGMVTVGWPWKSAGTAVPLMAPPGAGEGDVGAADGEGVGAELVGEDDADGGAAEGDVDDLAEGGVVGEMAVAVVGGDGRGGPGADPVVVGCWLWLRRWR